MSFETGTSMLVAEYLKSGRKKPSARTYPSFKTYGEIARGEIQAEVSIAATEKTFHKKSLSELSKYQRE